MSRSDLRLLPGAAVSGAYFAAVGGLVLLTEALQRAVFVLDDNQNSHSGR